MDGWLFFIVFVIVVAVVWGITSGINDRKEAKERGLTFDDRIRKIPGFTPSILLLSCIFVVACNRPEKSTGTITNGSTTLNSTSINGKKSVSSSLLDSLYQEGLPRTARMTDKSEEFAVFLNDDKKAGYDEDAFIVSLYVYNYKTRQLTKLLTTTEPEGYKWFNPVGKNASECLLTDIHSIYYARLFPYANKLLVTGCFDSRNEFSYIIDLDDKSAMLLPTNSGFVGFTSEEGYVVMQSYAYNSGVDENGEPKGGRHSVLSVFDENGTFIRSMDLESNQ